MMKIGSSLANDETFVINFITCRLLDWSSYVLYFHVLLQIVFEGREMIFYVKLVPPPTNLFSSQSRVVSPKDTRSQSAIPHIGPDFSKWKPQSTKAR